MISTLIFIQIYLWDLSSSGASIPTVPTFRTLGCSVSAGRTIFSFCLVVHPIFVRELFRQKGIPGSQIWMWKVSNKAPYFINILLILIFLFISFFFSPYFDVLTLYLASKCFEETYTVVKSLILQGEQFSLNWPQADSVYKSLFLSVSLSVCPCLETPLPGGMETLGRREYH